MKNNKKTTFFIFVFSLYSFCIFTQEANRTKYNELENKVQQQANRRLIKSGTHILSLALSNNQYPLIIKDPSVLLPPEITRGIEKPFFNLVDALYVNYQCTLPKNFFAEAGFKYLKHWTYFETNDWVVDMHDHYSGFSTLSFSLGSGYRFVGENSLRFFDVHAGVTLGVTDNPIGSGQYLSNSVPYQDGNGGIGVMSYSWQYQIISRYSLGLYLGLSKDIRVTKNLYVTARYHYQFGKNSELTEHIINYDLPTLDINNTVRASNTAKGQMFALGLRWVFDKK